MIACNVLSDPKYLATDLEIIFFAENNTNNLRSSSNKHLVLPVTVDSIRALHS